MRKVATLPQIILQGEGAEPNYSAIFNCAEIPLACGHQAPRVNRAKCCRVQFSGRPQLLQKQQDLTEVCITALANFRHNAIVVCGRPASRNIRAGKGTRASNWRVAMAPMTIPNEDEGVRSLLLMENGGSAEAKSE